MCIEAYRYQAGGAGVSEMWRQLVHQHKINTYLDVGSRSCC